LIKIYFDLSEHFIFTIPKLAFGLNLCFLTICLNLNYKLEARVATLDKKQKKLMKTQGMKRNVKEEQTNGLRTNDV
jgi:hypothetical protein